MKQFVYAQEDARTAENCLQFERFIFFAQKKLKSYEPAYCRFVDEGHEPNFGLNTPIRKFFAQSSTIALNLSIPKTYYRSVEGCDAPTFKPSYIAENFLVLATHNAIF